MSIVFGAIMPHPPILIPEIGGGRIKEAERSKRALEEAAKRIKAKDPDTIIVTTPHGEVGQSSVPIYISHVFEGNFGYFGMTKPTFSFKGDPDLGREVIKTANEEGVSVSQITETFLDHGILVPLYYPYVAGVRKPILPIAVAFQPLKKLYDFGKVLAKAIEKSQKKVVVIGSADLSHRLTPDAPAGYDPKGKEFDEKLVEYVKHMDVNSILNFDPETAERAGQDALWSIAILLGALSGYKVKHEVLSYEGPFGVGYMVATFEVIS